MEASLAQPVQPIAHWKADGSTENSSGRPSIIGNPAVSDEQGVLGQAFSCTLNSAPIATDLDAQPSAMRRSTWSCWIKSKGEGPARNLRRTILSTDDGGYDRTVLIEKGFISVFTGSESWQVAPLRPDEWTHVAVVWEHNSVVCYVDGEAFEYGGKVGDQSTRNKLSIGWNPGFGEPYIGLIDEIQIFKRALAKAEIQELYQQAAPKPKADKPQAAPGQAPQTRNETPASGRLPGSTAAPEVAKLQETPAPRSSEALRVNSADAASHIGEAVIVRGNVALVESSPRTGWTHINFGKPYPNMEFAASFETSNAGLANLRELEGRQGVEIQGTISADPRGRPQIVITSPEQVKSRGEPKAQGTSKSVNDASVSLTKPTPSASPSGAPSQRPDWVKPLRTISVADLTADVAKSLQQDGNKRAVLRGRLMGVTRYSDNNYNLWMTPAGASPAVSVLLQTTEGKNITLEEVGGWLGREIEAVVIVTIHEASGRVETKVRSEGDPWLADAQSAATPAQKFDPLAVFSGIPRLTVAELQKIEPPKPDAKGRTDFRMGMHENKPVVIVGKLRSARNDGLLMSSGIYGRPVSVLPGDASEETDGLQKLVGKEIAVVADHFFGANVTRDNITILPVTFLHEGRSRNAVFPVEELGALIQAPSDHGRAATEGHGSIAKAPTTSQAAESPAVQGTLLEPLRVEVKRDGKVSGSVTIKAGTSLPIVRQAGVRALVKHAGGESWLLTGNEWEATTIINTEDRVSSSGVALTLRDDRPVVAWINKKGLWFAEQKEERWEAQLVDAFPAADEHGNTSFTPTSCAVAVGEGGRVMIVYELQNTSLGVSSRKVAFRYGSQWTIERGPPGEEHHAIRFMGDIPEVLAEQYGKPCLARWKNGQWVVERLQEPSGRFYEWAGQVSDAGDVSFLSFEMLSSNFQDKEYQGEVQLRSLVGKEWKSEVIESRAAAKEPHYLRGKLACAGQHTFAAYQLAQYSPLRLARSSGSWQVKELNLYPLGKQPRLEGLCATEDGDAFLLFGGFFGQEENSLLAEAKRADPMLAEELQLGDTLALAVNSEGSPMVLFQDAEKKLSIATRKSIAQLATSQAENGVLQLPDIPPATVAAKPPLILPEKVLAGSEAERARRIASMTTTFSFPVDGEMTKFTRWGNGGKLIVFFNNNGVDKRGGSKFDMMPRSIAADLEAYAPLMEQGYSLVVWDYPHTARLARDLEGPKADLSGIAASVVEGIRKQTGASEMVLVGNSMGAGVLLWDLDKIASMDGVRMLLLSPTEFFMPSIDRLGDGLPNTTLIAIEPDPYLRSPEIMAWAAKHASPPGGILEADIGKYIGHLIIGQDRLTHAEVVRLIRQALQPANKGNTSSTN